MPRRGSPYGPAYEAARRRLLGNPCKLRLVCSGAPGTEADHVPPLSLHQHVEGSGCCRLQPACGPCQRRQAIDLANGRIHGAAQVDDDELVEVVEPDGFDVDDPVWRVPWLVDLLEMPDEAVWPRLMTVPHPLAVDSLGREFEWWIGAMKGRRLRWWQRLVARRLLEVDADRRLLWDVLVLSLARQLGKSWLLRDLIMWRMHQGERFGEPQEVLHTGKDLDVCRELFVKEVEWARAPGRTAYDARTVNSQEELVWAFDGSRWMVRAQTAVYGKTVSLGVVDEAWDVKEATVDEGMEATVIERDQTQLILLSTAHRKAKPLMLNRRAQAIAQMADPTDQEMIIEWSTPRDRDLDDVDGWRLASPQWTPKRERFIAKKVARALAGGGSDLEGEPDPVEAVKAQWLNQWPAYSTGQGRGDPLFEVSAWAAAELDVAPVGPLVLAVEDWAGRGAAAAAAGMTAAGVIVVGGFCFGTRAEAYEWVQGAATAVPGSRLLIGSTLVDDAEVAAIPVLSVEPCGSSTTRSSLSLLRELVTARRAVHDGSADVADQITSARVTPASGGGLSLVNVGRLDLVRCVAWVVAEADRQGALVPTVHGA